MRRIIIAILLFTSVAICGSAQEKGFSWGAFGSSSHLDGDFSFINLETIAGYNFTTNFSAFLKAETNVSLLEKGNEKNNYTSQALGLLLKYNIYKFDSGIIDIRAGGGKNFSNKDWEYVYYDAGLFLQATRERTKPTIGIGFRQYDVQTNGEKNRPSVYISVGFTFN